MQHFFFILHLIKCILCFINEKSISIYLINYFFMKNSLFYCLFALLLFAACDEPETELKKAEPIVLKSGMTQKVQQDNQFSFDLLRGVLASSESRNVFISPLSVSIAFGMVWNGADNQTREEIEQVLGLSGITVDDINGYYQIMQSSLLKVDPSTKLSIANSLWYRTGFSVKPDFLTVNKTYFDAEVRSLDFSDPKAVDIINSWCSDKTNGLIKKPLSNISAETMLYLINAIYFKGIWNNKFEKKNTSEKDFTDEDGAVAKVNMMQQTHAFGYVSDENAQYLDMPYGNEAFSMTVILPQDGKTTADVLESLDGEQWNSIQERLYSREIQVSFPRFKMENKFELQQVLASMGMSSAFTPAADFSKISDVNLLISKVIHSTYCSVDEEGTEAAAVTVVEIGLTSAGPSEPIVFDVNRPFLFVIRENSTGVILFAGKMGSITKY